MKHISEFIKIDSPIFDFTETPESDLLLKIFENDQFLTYAIYDDENHSLKYQDVRVNYNIEINKNMRWKYSDRSKDEIFSGRLS